MTILKKITRIRGVRLQKYTNNMPVKIVHFVN